MQVKYEKESQFFMGIKIMVCLDGSKNSLRGLDAAIQLAKESDGMIIGVHSDTSFSAFSAVRAPILPKKKWKNKVVGLMHNAQKKLIFFFIFNLQTRLFVMSFFKLY